MSVHSITPVDLRSYIRDLPDYPSPGIVFRDITPLLAEPAAFTTAVHALAELVPSNTDLIAGMEARGFIFGAALAHHMGIGFVPVRKAGKLPPPVRSYTYDLEYGQATIELRDETLPDGAQVVLLDDVLATGGTAAAGVALIEQCGAHVIQALFLMELSGLGGRDLLGSKPVAALFDL
ncbi:adenine phosphoribosyltransferase [Jonesia quinghaiensis]|uniref:adenine phosphoribosyltransferase n=1 Tax=Jonesia quinghaiensis TaxID=262806 RepID=UPI000426277F|nr:adenine phosphoribosyltransferase [Jonesia quinghaiensis]